MCNSVAEYCIVREALQESRGSIPATSIAPTNCRNIETNRAKFMPCVEKRH